MAMNPMQRKIRNSFLFGFLVAVIVAAVVIGVLFMQIKGLKQSIQEKEQEAKLNVTTVYALEEDVKKGGNIVAKPIDMISSSVPEKAVTDLSEYEDDEGELIMVALADLDAGTILTSSMVSNKEEAGSFRTVEYNSILLPSRMVAGEYIDIRIKFTGSVNSLDYIVLSKVRVEDCNSNTIWLTLSDAQMQLLDCAVVESYAVPGTKLYATQYSNDAQPKIAETYVPTAEVTAFIAANVQTDIDKEIAERYSVDEENANNLRQSGEEASSVREVIDSLKRSNGEEALDAVISGVTKEQSQIRAAREALMGEGY